MKVVLFIIGLLGGLYALFGSVQLIRSLLSSDAGSTYGVASISRSLVAVCLGLIVCLACFQRVFRKSRP
jgi:hypothetical protein